MRAHSQASGHRQEKFWMFAGSQRGGKAMAIAFTLIETAKLNGVDPKAWLTRRAQPYRSSQDQTGLRSCCPGISLLASDHLGAYFLPNSNLDKHVLGDIFSSLN